VPDEEMNDIARSVRRVIEKVHAQEKTIFDSKKAE
jgi:hypothetical protein